jgi:hypothetical protein
MERRTADETHQIAEAQRRHRACMKGKLLHRLVLGHNKVKSRIGQALRIMQWQGAETREQNPDRDQAARTGA